MHTIGKNLLSSYESFGESILNLSGCSSEVRSSASDVIIKLTDFLSGISGSHTKYLGGLTIALPTLISSLQGIVSSLDIGQLADVINGIIANVLADLITIGKTVQNSGTFKFGLAKKLCFESINKNVQTLTITIASITDKATSTVSASTKEAVAALSLVLESVLLIVHGFHLTIGGILLQAFQGIPPTLNALLEQLDCTVVGVAAAVASLTTSVVAGLEIALVDLSSTHLDLSTTLSGSLNFVFGAVENIAVTATQITNSLVGTLSDLTEALG